MGGGFAIGVHRCDHGAAHVVMQEYCAVVVTAGGNAPERLNPARIHLSVADVLGLLGGQMNGFDNVSNSC